MSSCEKIDGHYVLPVEVNVKIVAMSGAIAAAELMADQLRGWCDWADEQGDDQTECRRALAMWDEAILLLSSLGAPVEMSRVSH